jgi:hypothetical protein
MTEHRRRTLRLAALCAVAAISGATPAAAGLAQHNFRTPDGNVSCSLVATGSKGSITCWVFSVKCDNLDIGQRVASAWALPPFRGTRPVRFCPGDFVPSTSVLRYGVTLRAAGVRCQSLRTGLRCDRRGHGFLLGKRRQQTW